MSRYIPVRTTMDSEDHYHSPYDTHDIDSDAHYEAPTCLKRNPSGSLFIPSGDYKSQIILIYVVSSRACHGIFWMESFSINHNWNEHQSSTAV